MKKYLILICSSLLFITQPSNAQYHKLVDTNKMWSTFNHYGPSKVYETYFTKFNEDTIINLLHYYKVFKSFDSTQANWINDGYIREDSNHKVFYKKDISQVEFLLYDFNADVGDTIHRYISDRLTISLKVDSINTVNIAGSLRKRFYLRAKMMPPINEIWIEGIGSLLGIFYSGYIGVLDSYKHSLLCYYENDSLKYLNPEYQSCFHNFLNIEENKSEEQILLSNIENDFYILQASSIIKEIVICNILGGKIKNYIPYSNQCNIDLSHFSPGIYFLSIKIANKSFNLKLIKYSAKY
ncbi:MAG: T9SS type A sorting domain-containing protein [Bacteroidota bacterium]